MLKQIETDEDTSSNIIMYLKLLVLNELPHIENKAPLLGLLRKFLSKRSSNSIKSWKYNGSFAICLLTTNNASFMNSVGTMGKAQHMPIRWRSILPGSSKLLMCPLEAIILHRDWKTYLSINNLHSKTIGVKTLSTK